MSELVKYGFLHCHTDESNRDSVMTVKTLVNRAKELGAPAVALTDHGVMTGYLAFTKECEKEGINPILGVEAYVEEANEGRSHLILMAKDYECGFKALIKAVSESNERVDANGFPRMNKEILMRNFGPDSNGHGHVIATSACVSGVLASIYQANGCISAKTEKYKASQSDLENPNSPSYLKNKEKLDWIASALSETGKQITQCKKTAEKPTVALKKKLDAAEEGSEKKKQCQEAYDAVMKDKEDATKRITFLLQKKELLEKQKAFLTPIVKQAEKNIEKWKKLQEKIDEIEKNSIPENEIENRVRNEALWYQTMFGANDFYIELQYHGYEPEKFVMPKLAALSDELSIPVVLANDAHIPTKSGDDILARAIIRTARFLKDWEEPSAADKEMYLKTDEELKTWVGKIIPERKVMEGYENIGKITSECHMVFPKEKHYPSFVTPDGSTPEEYLRRMAYEGIAKKYPNGFPNEKEGYERLEHELDVICAMGYADYHCIVEDFLRYARAAGKLDMTDPIQEELALSFDIEKIEKFTKDMPGEAVGPGRGSAAGSLVCYLIGITNIDPLKYGLLFERFLNPERVSMPDIDCDIETNIRPYVIRYVKHKYGEKSVAGIMTRGKQTGKAAVKTAGRVYSIEKTGNSTTYDAAAEEVSKKAVELSDDELHVNLKEIEAELLEAFKNNKVASEIIRYAILIEGAATQIGQHAAGVIITDGKPVDEYVPLIYNRKNKIMMTQCDMTQAEEIGLLKMDFLGLNNLTVITEALREIKKTTGKVVDMDHISYEDPAVFQAIFASGMTNSVFQLESDGMKKMLKQFHPDSIFDLTLLVAMYRPGPLQFLADVIDVKTGKKEVSYLTPELEPILKNTYGSITYQEQVQEIFRSLAGYSLGQADIVRRAMSKKKDEVLRAERSSFLNGDPNRNIKGCVANGISATAANKLFDEMTNFAKYAFNKSHAACYAVVAYQTAWLKFYYPREYMKAVLNNADFDKIPSLMNDLKLMKINVETPNVNLSESGFSLHDGRILFGLSNIKGLGKSVEGIRKEREKNGLFQSLQEFILRTEADKKTLEGFTEAGAFDCFSENRTAILQLIPDYLAIVKKLKAERKKLGENYDEKKRESITERIAKYEDDLRKLLPDNELCEDQFGILKKERERLGVFASRHPMELYRAPKEYNAIPIASLYNASTGYGQNVQIIGIISDYAVRRVRKTGKEISFFTITDLSGSISVCCFSSEYPKVKDILGDDEVVRITGRIMRDENGETKIAVLSAEKIKQKTKTILIFTKKSMLGGELQNLLKPYSSQNGHPCKIYDTMMNEFRDCDLLLSEAVMKDERMEVMCGKKPTFYDFGV